MGRTKGAKNVSSSKELILEEAFKLFSSLQYEKVTFSEIEKSTGVTRGAIVYHFSNKENLFCEVVKQFVFDKMSVGKFFVHNILLKDFIKQYIDNCIEEKERLNKLGIDNINLALFNIENNAFMFNADMREVSAGWYNIERDVWSKLLQNAINRKEIRPDIDINKTARIFMHTYLGLSYSGIVFIKGADYNELREEFEYIYDLIK